MSIFSTIKEIIKEKRQEREISRKPTFEERNPEFMEKIVEVLDEKMPSYVRTGMGACFLFADAKEIAMDESRFRRYEDKEKAPEVLADEFLKRLKEEQPMMTALFALDAIRGVCLSYNLEEQELRRGAYIMNLVIKASRFVVYQECEESEYPEISLEERQKGIEFIQDKYDRYPDNLTRLHLIKNFSKWSGYFEDAACYYAYKKLCEGEDDGNYTDYAVMFERLLKGVSRVYDRVCNPTPKTRIKFFPELA